MTSFVRLLTTLATTLVAGAAIAAPAPVSLWRLDCGGFSAPAANFSDLLSTGQSRRDFVDSCYLIRHGEDLMLWDSGLSLTLLGLAPRADAAIRFRLEHTITDQLAVLGLKPEAVTILGISHNHSDHTGQAKVFTHARLLMAKSDFEALRQTPAPFFTEPETLRPWLNGERQVDLVSGDRDVFADGSVIMVALPGHTPGNHGLLVRLKGGRSLLLSGDALHEPGQLVSNALPPFNASRADSLASLDRIRGIVREAHATLVIQHDGQSVSLLPRFPEASQ